MRKKRNRKHPYYDHLVLSAGSFNASESRAFKPINKHRVTFSGSKVWCELDNGAHIKIRQQGMA